MTRFAWLLSACLIAGAVSSAAAQQKFTERWNYVRADLGSDKGQDAFIELMKQSKEAGCTHLMMVEGRWYRSPDDAKYQARVDKVKAFAKENGLTIVPTVYSLGYSGRYLGEDPNLCAGLPVKNEPFVVKGKTAVPDPSLTVDTSGLTTGGTTTGKLKVKPFTHYRLSFTLEGDLSGDKDEQVRLTGKVGQRWVTRRNPDSKKEEGKTIVETTFNSLEADELSAQISGKAKDIKIESAGLLMVIRRELCPLKVTSADGKTVYEEGKDFEKVSDPKLVTEGEFTFNHESPVIKLTDSSRIKDGDKLAVSFFHAYRLGGDQDAISMEDPAVFKIMEKDINNCAKVWKADGYFMNYDEIRLGGWETPDVKPGKILADHVKKGYDLVKKADPKAKVYTWSDMFTPFHNARDFKVKGFYYLVNGNWDGAWEGLPKDVIIMNWYVPKGKETESMKFFSDRGNPQIMCGFYDATATAAMKNNIMNWMKACQGVPEVKGFMYTTWKRNFKSMPEYFKLVDTYADWSKGGSSTPEKEPGVAE